MAQLVSRAQSVWEGSLDMPVMWLSRGDPYRLRDLFENVLVLGGIGSGKTSGVGKAIRHAMLKAGFGGIVHVAKADEIETWIADARACGRLDSVIIFDERQGYNFIAHELARQGADGINSVVEYLMRVLEIVRLAMPGGGRVGDAFWEAAARQLFRAILPVLYAAHGTVLLEDIVRFLTTAPTHPDQLQDEAWRQSSFMWQTMLKARRDPVIPLHDAEFIRIASFWKDEFARQDAKLRTNVTATVSTSLDRFLHGRLAKAFTQNTTVVPELIFEGAIILLAMPTAVWNEDGIVAQQLFKYATQRTVLSRNALPQHYRARPVFIYADEAQDFINSADPGFLSQSRSSRCASIYMTQSLPTLYAKIGGENAKHTGDMQLAQFATKVFANNSCPESNRFAAETIGRVIQRRGSYSASENSGSSAGMNMGESWNSGTNSGFSTTIDAQGNRSNSASFGSSTGYSDSTGRNRGVNTGQSVSGGYSEAMDYEIEPAEFSRALKTGGPANGGIVSAILFQAGRRFEASGRNWLLAGFQQ